VTTRLFVFSSLTSTLFLFGACSTIGDRARPPELAQFPPAVSQWPLSGSLFEKKDFEKIDVFLNKVVRDAKDPATQWWADFRRAQLWSSKERALACEGWVRLAAEPKFPLNRLAFLRAHEHCPDNSNTLLRLSPFNMNEFDPWLGTNALDVAIKKAETKKDRSDLVQLLVRKSKLPLRLEDKVELTKLAIKNSSPAEVQRHRLRLHRLSPSENPQPGKEDYYAVAQDFKRRRKFAEAEVFFRKIIRDRKAPASDVLQAFSGLRSNFKVQQRREEALAVAEEAFRFAKNSPTEIRINQGLQLARSYWTEDQKPKAIRVLADLEKKLSGRVNLQELWWLQGRMAEEDRDFERALERYQKITDPSERVLWSKAWVLKKMGRGPEAETAFEALVERSTEKSDKTERARARFWYAKVLRTNDKASKAEDIWEDLSEGDPQSYYGYLARRELDEDLVPLKDPGPGSAAETWPRSVRKRGDPAYFEWLVAVREDTVAKDYLDDLSEKLRDQNVTDDDDWTFVLTQYAKIQQYPQVMEQLQRLPEGTRKKIVQTNPALLFPRPYRDSVLESSQRFGVSVEFIYSIMRQESAFNPLARSHMDAFGLMQLLPQVAELSAQQYNISFAKAEDLYEPRVNIPLGSAHLKKLWDRYNGGLILAVASYNASEKAIAGWLKTRFTGDTLEFIEDIPYDETRDYVKLVLRNMITYQTLAPTEPIKKFPEWALHIEKVAP
jgi:soluble lytic murein transglycosylase